MRNYSAVVDTFITYNVNGSEYVCESSDVYKNVLRALAGAFESPEHHLISFVARHWDTVWTCANREVACECCFNTLNDFGRLTPSEAEVLIDFILFLQWVQGREAENFSKCGSRSFVYHNLNTGKSVVWTHVIC